MYLDRQAVLLSCSRIYKNCFTVTIATFSYCRHAFVVRCVRNERMQGCSCLSVRMFRLENRWTHFDKICYGCNATVSCHKAAGLLLNFYNGSSKRDGHCASQDNLGSYNDTWFCRYWSCEERTFQGHFLVSQQCRHHHSKRAILANCWREGA